MTWCHNSDNSASCSHALTPIMPAKALPRCDAAYHAGRYPALGHKHTEFNITLYINIATDSEQT
jgi:hypothetical protein